MMMMMMNRKSPAINTKVQLLQHQRHHTTHVTDRQTDRRQYDANRPSRSYCHCCVQQYYRLKRTLYLLTYNHTVTYKLLTYYYKANNNICLALIIVPVQNNLIKQVSMLYNITG